MIDNLNIRVNQRDLPLTPAERVALQELKRAPLFISREDDRNDVNTIWLSMLLLDLCVDGFVFRADGDRAIGYFITTAGVTALEAKLH